MDDFEPIEENQNNNNSLGNNIRNGKEMYDNTKELSKGIKDLGKDVASEASGSPKADIDDIKQSADKIRNSDDKVNAALEEGEKIVIEKGAEAAGAYFGGEAGRRAGKAAGKVASKVNEAGNKLEEDFTGLDKKQRTAIKLSMGPALIIGSIVFVFVLIYLAISTIWSGAGEGFKDLYELVKEEQRDSSNFKVSFPTYDTEDEDGEVKTEELTPLMFMTENEIIRIVDKYTAEKLKSEYNKVLDDLIPTGSNFVETEGVEPESYSLKRNIVKKYLLSEYNDFKNVTWTLKTGDGNEGSEIPNIKLREVGENWLKDLFGDFAKIPNPNEFFTDSVKNSSEKEEEMIKVYYNLLAPYLQNWVVPYTLNINTGDNDFGKEVLENMNSKISVELLENINITITHYIQHSLESTNTVIVKEDQGEEYTFFDEFYGTYTTYPYYEIVRYTFEGETYEGSTKLEEGSNVRLKNSLIKSGTREVLKRNVLDSDLSTAGSYMYIYRKLDELKGTSTSAYIEKVELKLDESGQPISVREVSREKVKEEDISYIPTIKEAEAFYSMIKTEYSVEAPNLDIPDYEEISEISEDGKQTELYNYFSKINQVMFEENKYKISTVSEEEYEELGREISRLEWLMDFGNKDLSEDSEIFPVKSTPEKIIAKFRYYTISKLDTPIKTYLNKIYEGGTSYLNDVETLSSVWTEEESKYFLEALSVAGEDGIKKIYNKGSISTDFLTEEVVDALGDITSTSNLVSIISNMSQVSGVVNTKLDKALSTAYYMYVKEHVFDENEDEIFKYIVTKGSYNMELDLSEEEVQEIKDTIDKFYRKKKSNDKYGDFDKDLPLYINNYNYDDDLAIAFLDIEEYYEKVLVSRIDMNALGIVYLDLPDDSGFLWPARGVIPSNGTIDDAISSGYSSSHPRIDIISNGIENVEILASSSGTVLKKGYDSTSGNYVILKHGNDFYTIYKYLKNPSSLNVGQSVSRGSVIGYMGSTGVASKEMLGFEIIKLPNNTPSLNSSEGRKDPTTYFNEDGTTKLYETLGGGGTLLLGLVEHAKQLGSTGKLYYYSQSKRQSVSTIEGLNTANYMDCSSFVSSMYRAYLGIEIGSSTGGMTSRFGWSGSSPTKTQTDYGNGWVGKVYAINGNFSQLLPGDIVIRRNNTTRKGHVGIYVGNEKQVDHGGLGGLESPYRCGPNHKAMSTSYTHFIRLENPILAAQEGNNDGTPINASAEDVEELARLIAGEARGEPSLGQVAVAAVVLNRVEQSSWPNTLKGVIYQNKQFSCTARDNYKTLSISAYIDEAKRALSGEDPTNGAQYFGTTNLVKSRAQKGDLGYMEGKTATIAIGWESIKSKMKSNLSYYYNPVPTIKTEPGKDGYHYSGHLFLRK